jgi:archaellum component FlaC
MDVHEVTWKEKLSQAEHKVARHERIRERQKLQHKRAIDRQQGDADALRVEVTHAKTQLGALEHRTKKAERNLDVVMSDRDREGKSQCDRLEKHVGKITTQLANVREHRAALANKMSTLARSGSRKVAKLEAGNLVRVLIFLFACSF